jgi:hypothetical protein
MVCLCCRAAQVVVISVIIGSLFAHLPVDANDARSYFGISFLSIMFLSMGAMPELGLTFQHKPCAAASLSLALITCHDASLRARPPPALLPLLDACMQWHPAPF